MINKRERTVLRLSAGKRLSVSPSVLSLTGRYDSGTLLHWCRLIVSIITAEANQDCAFCGAYEETILEILDLAPTCIQFAYLCYIHRLKHFCLLAYKVYLYVNFTSEPFPVSVRICPLHEK